MKSVRNLTFVFILSILMLVAGLVMGMLVTRIRSLTQSAGDSTSENGSLVEQLHLTPDQRDRMRAIWEGARDDIHDCYHDADSLQRQRDQAIAAILTDKQKVEFEKIAADFANRFADLNHKRDQVIQSAVNRTNQMLDAEQRSKYKEILRSRLNNGDKAAASIGVTEPSPAAASMR